MALLEHRYHMIHCKPPTAVHAHLQQYTLTCNYAPQRTQNAEMLSFCVSFCVSFCESCSVSTPSQDTCQHHRKTRVNTLANT